MSNFDKDWPHGHLLKYAHGGTKKARIIDTDLPGEFSIAAHVDDGIPDGYIIRTDPRGFRQTVRLINAPAPVKHAEAWVNVWRRLDGSCWYGSDHFDSLLRACEAAKNYETNTSTYIGAQRWCTDGTGGDIIGPDGKKVTL